MSVARSRQAERKAETRRELLAAAARVFAEVGFQAASLGRVASAAGFTTGAIYWHFPDGKDELFLAVFEEYALARVTAVTDVHAAAPPGFVVAALEFFVHALRVPALRDALAARLAAVRRAVGRILEADAREGGVSLPMPAQDIATVMRELGIGLALARLADPDAVAKGL